MITEFKIELSQFTVQVSLEELSACLDSLYLENNQIEEIKALWQDFIYNIQESENRLVSLLGFPKIDPVNHVLSRPCLFLQQLHSLIQFIHFHSDYEISMPNSHNEYAFISS